MKKLLLSLGLIIAFAFYAVFNNSKSSSLSLPASQQAGATSSGQRITAPAPVRNFEGEGEYDSMHAKRMMGGQNNAPSSPTSSTQMGGMMGGRMRSMMGRYKNGTYVGSAADAYFGNVQVQVSISGGKISDVQFLQYPSDRSTSLRISNYAMPVLKQEAIQAQNYNVDIVSGATQTSMAFQQSLASALAQAK